MKKLYALGIDTVGTCNLTCPSCPRGRKDFETPAKAMTVFELSRILDKAQKEARLASVALYTWTEPTLNPNLPDLIREVKRRGLVCIISTNLNTTRERAIAMMAARPDIVVISVSGYYQDVYQRGHASGNIELVKKRMSEVALARREGSSVEVLFHDYNDNEMDGYYMDLYCQRIGLKFRRFEARIISLEAVVETFLKNRDLPQYASVESRLINPTLSFRDRCKSLRNIHCAHLDRTLLMDANGNVRLCCGVLDPKLTVGNFFDLSLAEIEKRKKESAFCKKCLAVGGHVFNNNLYSPWIRARVRATKVLAPWAGLGLGLWKRWFYTFLKRKSA